MDISSSMYVMRTNEAGEEVELEYEVTGYWSPPVRGRLYMKNGDPGYPDEPGEMEDIQVWFEGKEITDTLSAEETKEARWALEAAIEYE